MGRRVLGPSSTAFTNEGPGKVWADACLEFLREHIGQLFTMYELWAKVGGSHIGLKRDSALTTGSLRWLYAGFNGSDDPWLHIERVRLPSKAFAYRYVTAKRAPERTESPAEHKHRLAKERVDREAKVLLSQGATSDGKVSPAVLDAARRMLAEQTAQAKWATHHAEMADAADVQVAAVEAVEAEKGPQSTEVAGEAIRRAAPEVMAEIIAEQAPPAPKEGFDVGDLVEVIGFTRPRREPLLRDTAGYLYRIVPMEFDS
jgi:hypothetical protein